MSRDVRSGRSSRPRHRRVLYFPHRRLSIMECSCKVLCKPCRRRLTLRLHSKPSWRLRYMLGSGLRSVESAIHVVFGLVGDATPLEEAVESDSERGD
ncbi:hypothetical protein Taro_004362 [Colocasia esculenta]|uniref:Uncharacterized protein n=1 Tax=Colocasia esculenta TaxID=4460 RepID=A0A843TPB8_COLES|nr:hypothetical protein [Colocasia esculenta]